MSLLVFLIIALKLFGLFRKIDFSNVEFWTLFVNYFGGILNILPLFLIRRVIFIPCLVSDVDIKILYYRDNFLDSLMKDRSFSSFPHLKRKKYLPSFLTLFSILFYSLNFIFIEKFLAQTGFTLCKPSFNFRVLY